MQDISVVLWKKLFPLTKVFKPYGTNGAHNILLTENFLQLFYGQHPYIYVYIYIYIYMYVCMYVCILSRTVELVEENVSMQGASPTIAKKTLFL